jgi:ABC-2 type transport system permease protein
MNFIDKFFLWLVLQPAFIYRKLGVNRLQLYAVLSAKLTMDNRRPASFGGRNRGKEKKEISKATLTTMGGALMMGLIMLYTFGIGNDMVTKLAMYMSMFIFMICITLITDFTSVLIDVRDNLIILPKPISDVTFVTARLLHITIRTTIVVLPMTLPGCITAAIIQGPAIILPFILMMLLMTLLGIFFINAIYILILKITTPVKFQSVIGSIQIGFVVLMMASYQIMPRMVQSSILSHVSVSTLPYMKFYPPYWFADACMLLSGNNLSSTSMMSLVLSIFIPLLSIWLVVRFFAPSFNRKLGMITGGTAEQSAPRKRLEGSRKISLLERLAGWLTKPGAEFAGFLFAGRMIGRSRDFKMKVFPSIGYMIVFAGMMLFRDKSFAGLASGEKVAPMLLMVIYMSSMLLSTAMIQLPYTDKFKASWLFFVAPIERPGLVISGAVKCVMILFFVPLALALVVLGLVLQGPSVLPNLLLGCLNVLVIGSLIAYIMVKQLPFSTAQEGAAGGSTFIRSMLLLILPGAFGLVHYFLSGFQWVILLLLLITAIIPWLVFDEIKKRDWSSLKNQGD